MISRLLLLVPSFTKKEGLKNLQIFFNNTQVFHPMYSVLNTVNLGLCDYVPFSQIRSHIVDIIIFGKSFDQHLHNLQQVLDRLRQAGLKLHPSKCQFLQQKVTFLGHIISQNGIYPDPDKTLKVTQWPTLRSAKEFQQFLGLANYYRKFVKDFAAVAKPLHKLTEKGVPFLRTDQCQGCFNSLKSLLTSAPILALPDWSRPFCCGH